MHFCRLWNGMFGGVGGQHTTIVARKRKLFVMHWLTLGAMGQVYCLNYTKSNTDISFYQTYLPKLRKNILKYYRLNYSKKLLLASTTTFSWLQNFLQAFPMAFFFKLVNTAVILAFISSLVLHGVLLVSCSTVSHT